MTKYWLVCLVFLPVGVLMHKISLDVKEIVITLLIGGNTINGEWWYVTQYIVYLLTIPFLENIISLEIKKERPLFLNLLQKIGCCLAILFFAWIFRYNFSKFYYVIFVMAYIIGYYNIFEKFNNIKIPKWINFLMLFLISILRIIVVNDANDVRIDLVEIPFFVYFIVRCFHTNLLPMWIDKAIKILGKYSTFIWLTHTFWIYYYFQQIVFLPKLSGVVFVWAFALSLLTAFLLEKIHSCTRKYLIINYKI